jgi:hypothetical protein
MAASSSSVVSLAVRRSHADGLRDDVVVRRLADAAVAGLLIAAAGYVMFGDHPASAPAACQVDGLNMVAVPDVVGKPLQDAMATVRAGALRVVADGGPADAGAVVLAQEPPRGVRVPVGACVGFRTRP